MLPTKFRNNWPFSLEEAKNRFSRWQPCPASWISDQSNFSYFWPTSHPAASYQVSSQLVSGLGEAKRDFQAGRHGGHLGFPISTILAILIYKSSQCFLPSLKSIGFSVQEKKRKIHFEDGRHDGHLGIQIGTFLAIFDLKVTPMLPTKYWVNWPRGVGVSF